MKLQARLLLGIVPAVAVGVLALAWVVFTELRTHSEDELLERMELVVGQTKRRTDSFLATAAANARLFARSTIVERYVRVEDEQERFELMQPAVLELFASYRAAYPGYVEIQLLLPDGYEDTRLARPGRANLTEEEAGSEFFEAMRAAGGATRTAFLTDPDEGGPVFKIGQPILLKDLRLDPALAEAELYAYLVVTAASDFLVREVVAERIGSTGHFFLVDGRGRVVAHPDAGLVGTRAERFETLLGIAAASGPAVADGGAGAGRRLEAFGGRPVILSATRLHDNLLLVGVLPERELRAVSRSLARGVVGVTLATICLAVAFFWLLLRRQVLLPLAALQRTAVAIGDGRFDLAAAPPAPREDEIGALELAFRDMHAKLARSMAELQGSYSRIHELAYEDSLTGLANRRQFLESLAAAVDAAARRGARLAVLYLDLDEFKRINDLLGHDAGDELLLEIARRLRACVRRTDVATGPASGPASAERCIARLGGDEFIVLLPGLDGADDALGVARRVLASLTAPVELRGQSFVVGSSVGVALYPDHALDADGLVKCADTAMYAVKHEMKNGAKLYGPGMRRRLEDRVRLESDLRLALERDELRLAYQPQLRTRTGEAVGFEALLRWEHPERGPVSPATFVPMAEQTGLIGPIGAWVIDEACRQRRLWSELGIDPGRIAVNVSPRQFALHAVDDVVGAALERRGVGRLRARGVRVAMDDFGTGHSSLATLAALPIDTLKIDRGFVTEVHADADRGSIMSAVLSLARDLGLETLAEGVETGDELAFLAARDCDLVQGYLLSRPLTADAATAWLTARAPRLDRAA